MRKTPAPRFDWHIPLLGALGFLLWTTNRRRTKSNFDLSGEAQLEGAVTVEFPASSGFAAAFALLPSLQRLMIDLAGRHVPRVGEPLRTSKVTGIE